MTNEELEQWYKDYDEGKEKFKWFIEKYFGIALWNKLEQARAEKNEPIMREIINTVWFYLPNNKFDIIENPEGWTEFLRVIEV